MGTDRQASHTGVEAEELFIHPLSCDDFEGDQLKHPNSLPRSVHSRLSADAINSSVHDLCQPLTTIHNNAIAAKLLLENGNREDLKAAVEDIVASSRYASEIAQQICKALRKEFHLPSPVDLNSVIRECLDLIRRDLAEARCNVSVKLQPELPKLIGIRIQLQQIFLNLFTNGIEAMRESINHERAIHVTSTVLNDDMIQVTIRDSGQGIDKKHLHKIFDPLFSTKTQGTGIGLWLSREIARAHRGNIEVYNNKTKGATFRLTFRSSTSVQLQW